MKAVTLDSAKDELLGALIAAGGVIAGSLVMKMASGKVNKWLVPAIGLGGGYAIRLMTTNESYRDAATGLLVAGALDGLKKGLDAMAGKVAILDTVNASIPTLSGPGISLPSSMLRGFAEGQVVSSQLLR